MKELRGAEAPAYQAALVVDFEPGVAGGGAFVGFADGAGVEDAGGADHFVARDVGVAVEEEFRAAGAVGRDVDEEEGVAATLKEEAQGEIEAIVVVAKYGVNGWANGFYSVQGRHVAKIAEVPDFVGGGELRDGGGGEAAVGVRNNSNLHERWQNSGALRSVTSFMWKTAHEHILKLVAYEPGKPVEELAREMGLQTSDIIKLASNENPLGPSPKALAAMHDALERAHFYPDGGGWALRTAIAEKLGLARENVVLGNGSNELIEFIGHAFLRDGDEVIVARHAFAVYGLMAQLFGAKTIEVPDPGYKHDLKEMLSAVTRRTRQIFVANPNNPTGTLVSQEEIDEFMAAVPSHVLVIFDEAYFEFLDHAPDVLKYVREGRNVVVMRTFSKIQGLASLRIGYGLAPKELAEVLQKTRQPFNANGIAQAGAAAGVLDDEHMRKTRELTHEGREYFESEFRAMNLEYVPSAANFVLVRVGDGDLIFQALLTKGIIVRAMRSYKLPGWIRVSVGTMEQNRRFITELRALDAAGQVKHVGQE